MNKAALLIISCLALMQSASGNISLPRFNTQVEEYAVYSAVLKTLHRPPANKVLMVLDNTRSPVDQERLFDECNRGEPHPSMTTLTNFIRMNAHPRELDDELDTEYRHTMLSIIVFDDIFKDGCSGWCPFVERYPDSSGFVSFSRVGFNGRGTQALVYVVRMCGGLCGGGGYVLLEKKGGAWQAQRWLALWVS